MIPDDSPVTLLLAIPLAAAMLVSAALRALLWCLECLP